MCVCVCVRTCTHLKVKVILEFGVLGGVFIFLVSANRIETCMIKTYVGWFKNKSHHLSSFLSTRRKHVLYYKQRFRLNLLKGRMISSLCLYLQYIVPSLYSIPVCQISDCKHYADIPFST